MMYSDQEGDEPEEFLSLEEKDAKAKEVTLGRILTDADFKKIDAAQLRKQVYILIAYCMYFPSRTNADV